MTQTVTRTTPDQITQALTTRIIRGDLMPGAPLRQDHIAKEFATSHVPVREALLRLEATGLAISIPRKGMRVSDVDSVSNRELQVMRSALEPAALRHSVPKLTPLQIEAAEAARLACDAAQDIFAWEAANRDFHMATYAGCEMPRLMTEVGHLQLLGARRLLSIFGNRWRPREDADHRAIMGAIRNRDADLAVNVLERHLSRLG